MLARLGDLIACLFERHKFIRRSAMFLLYALLIGAHVVIYRAIWLEGGLSATALGAFTETLGLTGIITKWYMDVRRHEDAGGNP